MNYNIDEFMQLFCKLDLEFRVTNKLHNGNYAGKLIIVTLVDKYYEDRGNFNFVLHVNFDVNSEFENKLVMIQP